jgi:hypothetical protein
MSQTRASKAELLKRRQEIQELILKGVPNTVILKAMADKWETSTRAIGEDIRSIAKEWNDTAPEANKLMRNKYADRLELLFNTALAEGHIKTALEIQKEIHKLNGLYQEKDVKDTMPDFINVSKRGNLKVVDGSENE